MTVKTKDQEETIEEEEEETIEEEEEEEIEEEVVIEVDHVLLAVTLEVTNNLISELFNTDNR
jgi:hypothetical protein